MFLYGAFRSLFVFRRPTTISFYYRNLPRFFSEEKAGQEGPLKEIAFNDIVIPKEKIIVNYVRSSGPGGQHVNKTNSKAEIRFNILDADWLQDRVKQKLRVLQRKKINKMGELVITSQEHREQERNLQEAFAKLKQIIFEASKIEKERIIETDPETEQMEFRRIQGKRKRSDVKKLRSGRSDW
eukprot:TRINITY_DN4256_c0_g1_i2.p1 TRINITY_DN4256_c0_g1~~TRINITY_DN4256_c0_g1_i2.p1  ORF type:complete len:183 (-),score=37.86 TRINITY_DN4256_c0_g1_i2:124-672(-)